MHLKINYLFHKVLLMALIIESTKATLCGNNECRGLNSRCDLNKDNELVCECLNGSSKRQILKGIECVERDEIDLEYRDHEDSHSTEISNESTEQIQFPKEINADGEIFIENPNTDKGSVMEFHFIHNAKESSQVEEEKGEIKEKCVEGRECNEVFNDDTVMNELGDSVNEIDYVENDSTLTTESIKESTTSKVNLFKLTNKVLVNSEGTAEENILDPIEMKTTTLQSAQQFTNKQDNESNAEENIVVATTTDHSKSTEIPENTRNINDEILNPKEIKITTLQSPKYEEITENSEFETIKNAAAITGEQQIDETSKYSNFDDIINIFGFGDIICANNKIQCLEKCCDDQQVCNYLGECVTKINEISKTDANTSTAAAFYTFIGLGCIVAALGFALFKLHKFKNSTTF